MISDILCDYKETFPDVHQHVKKVLTHLVCQLQHPLLPTITLYRRNGIWMGLYSGPGADVVRRLFGTEELPTPFTADVDADRVFNAIQTLNPDKIVVLEAGE